MKMNVKYPAKKFIKNNLAIFIIALVAIPVASIYLIRFKTKPQDYEKYALFIGASAKNTKTLSSSLQSHFPNLLDFKTYSIAENDSLFASYYQGYASRSDIIILSKTRLDEFTNFTYFEDISHLDLASSEPIYKNIGIPLDKTNSCILNEHVNYLNDTYYLMIHNESVHLKGITDGGKTNYTYELLKVFNLVKGEKTL